MKPNTNAQLYHVHLMPDLVKAVYHHFLYYHNLNKTCLYMKYYNQYI